MYVENSHSLYTSHKYLSLLYLSPLILSQVQGAGTYPIIIWPHLGKNLEGSPFYHPDDIQIATHTHIHATEPMQTSHKKTKAGKKPLALKEQPIHRCVTKETRVNDSLMLTVTHGCLQLQNRLSQFS